MIRYTSYNVSNVDILAILSDLLAMPILQFESEVILQNFIDSAQHHINLDLSDLLIVYVAHAFDCQSILTFDKKTSKFKYFELLK